MTYFIDGSIGGKTTRVDTTATHRLGETHRADKGQLYIYVQANNAIAQYSPVCISPDYQCDSATVTLAATRAIGVAQVAFANDEFGWVAIQGQQLTCLYDATSDIAPGKPLAISTLQAGNVAMYTTTTQIKLAGVSTTVSVTGDTSVTGVISLNGYGAAAINI